MKKVFIYRFFIILILSNNAFAMQLRPISRQLTRKNYVPKTVVYTKPNLKLILTDKFKQYYRKLERWWYGPALTHDQILKEADLVVNKLKTKTSGSIEDLDYFLKEQNQHDVNIFLNRLITTKEGLFLLNEYTFALLKEYGSKEIDAVFKKIITWAEDDILKIFHTIPSLENRYLINNFFLITLLVVPEYHIQENLIKNASTIIMTPNGRLFFTLLKEEIDPVLYDLIITRNPQIPLQLKTIAAEHAEKLITRE